VSVYPQLTTVRQPLAEMGARATQMLLELIENPAQPAQRVELPTDLIVRASTRAIK
jgi:LacI family transcriptional regulator